MCTKFAYDAYKEREKNMETTKEIRKVNGKQYMTINAIAEASGIARDSLTNRFYRFKKSIRNILVTLVPKYQCTTMSMFCTCL